MPTYSLTSPTTGQSYDVDFSGAPSEADMEQAVAFYDQKFDELGGQHPRVLNQSTAGTAGMAAFRSLGDAAMNAIGGLAKLADVGGAQSFQAITGLPISTGLQDLAKQTDQIKEEARRVYPTNPLNPKAETIGGGIGQGAAMLATSGATALAGGGGAAMATVPSVIGFLSGAGEGIDTAKEIGVSSPMGQLAMGLMFGGVEAGVEKLGGIGGRESTQMLMDQFRRPMGELLKQAAKSITSEGAEESVTGAAQDVLKRAFASEDPNNPGFTTTGVELPKLDRKMLEQRGMEFLGGAAGGTVFAGAQAVSNAAKPLQPASVNDRTVPTPPADQTVPDAGNSAGSTPAAGSPVSPLPGIAQRAGTVDVPPLVPGLEAEDIGPITSADVQDMETIGQGDNQMPQRQPILSGVPDRVAPFRDRPLNAEPQMSGDVITDLRIPRSPEAIAESQRIEQERQQQIAEMRMLDAKARGMPLIADSPTGSRDILDWANENPIYLPPGFSEERKLPEYEALGRNPLPNYWRQFVASGKQGGNPDTVAQRAFDAGLIAEPTADAYMQALQDGIAGRKQYRVQFQQREKDLAQEEKRVVDFEKSQSKLAKKPDTQQVPFEDIVPGDRMAIDGEPAVVKNVEYNEDGYLTNVVIEDGKRFGLMQFDPQNRGGILVDEYQPKPRPAVEDFAPADGVGQPMSEAPTSTTTTPAATGPAGAPAAMPGRGEGGSGGAGGAALLDVAPSTRPRNRGETAKPQREDVLAELGQATREGAANQAQGVLPMDPQRDAFLAEVSWQHNNTRLAEAFKAASRAASAAVEAAQARRNTIENVLPPGWRTIPMPKEPQFERYQWQALLDENGNDVAYPLSQDEVLYRAWNEYGADKQPDAATDSEYQRLKQEADRLVRIRDEAAKAWDAIGNHPRTAEWNAQRQAEQEAQAKRREATAKGQRTKAAKKGFQNLDTSGRTAGFLNTEILAEAEALVRRGVRDFAVWSRAMIARFGEGIRTYLAGVWDNVRRNSQLGAVMNPFARGPLLAPASDMASTSGAAQNAEPSPGGLSEAEDYRGEHRAPTREDGAPLSDVTANGIYPDDVYGPNGLRYYGTGDDAMDAAALAVIRRMQNKPAAKITVYRAVPLFESNAEKIARFEQEKKFILKTGRIPAQAERQWSNRSEYFSWISDEIERLKTLPEHIQTSTAIKPGDWVTTVRKYAVDHGKSALNDLYRIESKSVRADELFTDGNSWLEWGYDPASKGFQNLDTSGRTAGFLNTEILAEATDLLRQGITDFTNWSRAMLTRFGRGIRDYLQGIWAQITSPQTNAAQNVRLGLPQGTAPVSVGAGGFVGTGNAPAANETQARFASPDAAQRVINGPRADVDVAAEATAWLDSVSSEAAVDAFASRAVPLPLDAAEFAAATLISRLTMQGEQAKTEAAKLAAHVQAQRMARVWTKEYLSADPARALRQRGVVNNTILRPIAPVMATQGILVDRADAVMNKRFEGGAGGVVEKVKEITNKVDATAGTELAADLDASTAPAPATGPRREAVKRKHFNLHKALNALRKKIAPGMSWADIFMDMPSSQRERQREIYRRLMLDERLKDLTMEQRLDLTNELDRAWQRERKAVFNRELEKAGILGEKDKGDRDKVKKALPKLLRLMNLGMFNSEMWREIVAPEYGLKMLTAADTAQLRAMAEAAWKLPEGVIRNQKLRDLLNAIQKKTGASWVEVLNSYWTAAVLSGLRTQFDTWLAAVNGMGTNLMQLGSLIARGQGRAAIDAHAQWWRGLFEGVRESGQILFKGDTSYLKRFGADLKKALEGETSVTPVPLGENLWQNGNTFQKYGLAPVMMFTGRLMAAADHINNTATTQGAIAVARALHPELYQGKVGFTAAERANARAQALREVTGGREPQTSEERATVSARAREILNGSLQAEDYAAASEIGDMAAYQNDPTGLFGVLYSAMKQGLGSIQRGLNDYAQDVTANRFARIAAGVMAGSLHGVTGTRFMRFGANFGADMTRYIPGSYVLGKAGFYGREVSQAQQELLLGKNLVGLMLMSTLAAVFLNSDDEDEGWQIEGDWSTLNPQQVKERMAAGLERMTLWKRENGQVRRVSYKQWPTMGLFSVVGGMLDEKRHKPAQFAQHGTAGHLLRGIATGYTQIKNVSAVRNLVELFGEPTFSADAVDGTIEKMIKTGTNFAGGFVPTLIKDADIWTDPRSFKPEGVAEMMMRNTPILRKYVNDGRPQLNLLGEEVKLQRAPWSRAHTNVQSAEAHRVLGALLARGLALPMPSDEVKLYQNGVKVPLETLGREAVWQYERAVGQGYKDWLSTDGAALLTLPVNQAEKAIQRRAETIKRQALGRVQR